MSVDIQPTELIHKESNSGVVAVIGAGAFGTALAHVAGRGGHTVRLYARSIDMVNSINEHRRNLQYLPEFKLSDNVIACNSVEEALAGADLVILALPTQTVPDWLRTNKQYIDPNLLLCNTAKGLYLKNGSLLSIAINQALDREQPYCVLSGPSFAKEIMMDQPTAVVVASRYLYHAVKVQRMLSSILFRCYTSQDVVGVELGGALKNPLAIGAGLIEGSGMGINTMAAYITRSSQELQILCKAMGGEPQTISGLAGIGDLILTAFGDLSRNRTLGIRLTRGDNIEQVMKEMTVEGVPTATVAVQFADQCNLELPIFRAVAAILSGELQIKDAHAHLMGRPLKSESAAFDTFR
eukprot:gene6941-9495_t